MRGHTLLSICWLVAGVLVSQTVAAPTLPCQKYPEFALRVPFANPPERPAIEMPDTVTFVPQLRFDSQSLSIGVTVQNGAAETPPQATLRSNTTLADGDQPCLSTTNPQLTAADVASAASNMSALKVIAIVNREYKRTNTLTGVLTDCIHLDPFLEADCARTMLISPLYQHRCQTGMQTLSYPNPGKRTRVKYYAGRGLRCSESLSDHLHTSSSSRIITTNDMHFNWLGKPYFRFIKATKVESNTIAELKVVGLYGQDIREGRRRVGFQPVSCGENWPQLGIESPVCSMKPEFNKTGYAQQHTEKLTFMVKCSGDPWDSYTVKLNARNEFGESPAILAIKGLKFDEENSKNIRPHKTHTPQK